MAQIRPLGDVVQEVLSTGQPKTLTKDEAGRFRSEFAAAIAPEIDRIRIEQRRAFAECLNLVLD